MADTTNDEVVLEDTDQVAPDADARPKKPWPIPMIAALVVAALAVVFTVAMAAPLIINDALHPNNAWFGLGILVGVIFLIPVAVVVIIGAFVVARYWIARIVYTVAVAVLVGVWARWTFGVSNATGAYVTWPTVALVVSAILLWLPGNTRFFVRDPKDSAQADPQS
ncbi:MAG: hypothetical protein FWD75_00685 [Propionibacteriaceae bacterium]|nr:hypothetical protein [Propionibacteriaceae bacterium]